MIDYKRIALFAGGVLFGTAGIKVLTSKDAKKVYSQTTAAVLRMKDCVMNTVTNVQEEAGDIYATAQEINEKRAVADAEQVEHFRARRTMRHAHIVEQRVLLSEQAEYLFALADVNDRYGERKAALRGHLRCMLHHIKYPPPAR